MEICFIPDGDYAAWLRLRGVPRRGLCGPDGPRSGPPRGIHHYTLPAPGLGIPAGHRLFVSALRPAEQQVVLSDGSDLMADQVWGDWNGLAP